jgi:hypothetical protein
MIKKIKPFFLWFAFSSCNSCLHGFYGVHEKPTPINISFNIDNIKISRIKNYIDSLNAAKQKDSLKCFVASIKMDENSKIFCSKDTDCECYLLSFSFTKITIKGFYVSGLSANSWLLFQEEINSADLNRLDLKFKNEVIDKFL